jgi:subtilisin-like proprotein convertase family protein
MISRLRAAAFASCLVLGTVLAGSVSAQTIGVVPAAPEGCTASTSSFTQSTPVPIPDPGAVTSTVAVSGVNTVIWDLNVRTNLTHANVGNLRIKLTSPQGTTTYLSFENGVGFADVFNGTVWDDQGPVGVHLADYVTGVPQPSLIPDEPMSKFSGEDPNGTWKLTVTDILAGDTGTLNSWTLEVTTLQAAPASASVTAVNTTPLPIPDNDTDVTTTIDFPAGITSACKVVVKTNLTHTDNGDIVMHLTSPSATEIALTVRNAKGFADVFNGTSWDDAAPDGVRVHSYADGVPVPAIQPEEAMGKLIGENPTGTWTLTLRDAALIDVGTLNSWQITITNCTCQSAAPTSPLRVDAHGGSGPSGNNGVFDPGETVQVETTWSNPSVAAFDLTGAATNFTGPAGPNYQIVDGAASFGTVNPLASANCFDATGDCYSLQVTGARPQQHWDTTFDETVTPNTAAPPSEKTWTLHIGGSFADVATDNLFYPFIENIFHNGVTGGCTPTDYCPTGTALRKQMAVFVLKAKEGPGYTPPPATGIFTDVPAANPFAPWIEELFHRNVVAGCGPGPTYCPDSPVLRQQMAVFLLKTELGSDYVPPQCTGVFPDVTCPGTFTDWIEDLFARGIAAGCGNGNFCPTNPNTRGQMAPFLVKTFGLVLYGP